MIAVANQVEQDNLIDRVAIECWMPFHRPSHLMKKVPLPEVIKEGKCTCSHKLLRFLTPREIHEKHLDPEWDYEVCQSKGCGRMRKCFSCCDDIYAANQVDSVHKGHFRQEELKGKKL
jgi:hypothetical protein